MDQKINTSKEKSYSFLLAFIKANQKQCRKDSFFVVTFQETIVKFASM